MVGRWVIGSTNFENLRYLQQIVGGCGDPLCGAGALCTNPHITKQTIGAFAWSAETGDPIGAMFRDAMRANDSLGFHAAFDLRNTIAGQIADIFTAQLRSAKHLHAADKVRLQHKVNSIRQMDGAIEVTRYGPQVDIFPTFHDASVNAEYSARRVKIYQPLMTEPFTSPQNYPMAVNYGTLVILFLHKMQIRAPSSATRSATASTWTWRTSSTIRT